MARLFVCIAALMLLTACLAQDPTWYEDRCLRLGFKAGSADFKDCIERDQSWIDENRRRASGTVGP
jgi:hypothetical protein